METELSDLENNLIKIRNTIDGINSVIMPKLDKLKGEFNVNEWQIIDYSIRRYISTLESEENRLNAIKRFKQA